MAKYNMTPKAVKPVRKKHRRIVTKIPVPESLPLFRTMAKVEPRSMSGQPPIIWDRAEGFYIYDKWGNKWLDWSSGVLVTNAGHGRKEIAEAIKAAAATPLLATYVFPHEGRIQLCKMLTALAPKKTSYKVFLLSTGSEATENAIKLARTYGIEKGGDKKHVIISFTNAFHGRTLGAQLAGGMDKLKKWIVKTDCGFIQTPFPDGYKNPQTSFTQFLNTLKQHKFSGANIAGVICESYQGVGPDFLPAAYAKRLGAWCKKNDVVLIMDEVQAGFGRTGKMFAYEHYEMQPDLICCGKGISSSMPISAVIGRADIMDLYPAGSMTSTHAASPIPVAAAIANLSLIKKEKLVQNARKLDKPLRAGLLAIQKKYPRQIGCVQARGLVAGMQIVKPGTKTPDAQTALAINQGCLEKGLLMFAPVGIGGECVKIAPPLILTPDALQDGLAVLDATCAEVLTE